MNQINEKYITSNKDKSVLNWHIFKIIIQILVHKNIYISNITLK